MFSALVSFFRGRTLLLGLIGAIVASAAGFGAGWKTGRDSIRAHLLKQTQEALRIQAASFAEDLKRRDDALLKREQELQKRRAVAETWKRRYEMAKRKEPDCKAWAGQRLPRCVVERLRERLSGSETGNNSAGANRSGS